MPKSILITSLFFVALTDAFAQDYKKLFNELTSQKDTIGQLECLKKWEAENNNDPELYVAYFNYFVNKSRQELIEIGHNPRGEHVLEIRDTDTSNNEPVAYMYGSTHYNSALLKKGLDYADIGIEKNPSRLDIRFGKTYIYGQVEDWENFTSEIIRTVEYSATIENKWTWTDSKPLEDSKKFMLGSIQDYQLQLYETNNDNLLENMKQIANSILKYYPDHIESLSNLSIVYLLRKEYDVALETLLIAEKLAPSDFIVLSNIAHTYKLKGDNKKAIEYYELTAKHGDTESKNFARQQIEELRK